MKKLILLLSLALNYPLSFAQITSIDYPNVGDTICYVSGNPSGMNMGSPGPGQLWEFEGIVFSPYTVFYCLNPAFVPYGTQFPGSNLAMVSSVNGEIKYMEKTAGYVKQHGDLQPLMLKKYSTPLTFVSFPADIGTYNSTTANTSIISDVGVDTTVFGCVIEIDSTQVVGDITLKSHFDATGILALPTDTFLTSYRTLITTIKKDSMYIYCPNGISGPACSAMGISAPIGWSLASGNLAALMGIYSMQDSIKYYSWYVPGEKGEVCSIGLNSSMQPVGAIFQVDYATFSTGIDESSMIPSKPYPNPASDFVQLEWNDAFIGSNMMIYSTEGKLVSSVHLTGATKIDLREIPVGNYVYLIGKDNNQIISSGKIIIHR